MNWKRVLKACALVPFAALALLYGAGYIGQFIYNYSNWQAAGGTPGDGTSPILPSATIGDCFKTLFVFPYGLIAIGIIAGILLLLTLSVMRMGRGEGGEYDRDRNLVFSDRGTYGTSGFMSEKEMKEVLDVVPDLRKHDGTILGEYKGKAVCVPPDSIYNRNIAVYGASGSKKTRAFAVNMALQCAKRGESLIITDSKSEIYEKTSAYFRELGYTVKIFNLVSPESSDSWNCLAEIGGQELMAQMFCDIIIKNTGSERGDHFWDSAELNFMKSLCLLVDTSYPPEGRNIGQVYKLLTLKSEKELDGIFAGLPPSHPAKAPYSIFQQASQTVRSGVIIGLGSRIAVFQNKMIRMITSHDEIDLELPGKERCVYYIINSDQDSTFDFLASLFLSFLFIKLVRFADKHCDSGRLPVPVHILGEELTACGVIPDLSRKISVIRSRNISISLIFQNLAGLQNRYPHNQWQEILGNCDISLFLGCTDELTASFISARTGETSVAVLNQAKELNTWRVSNYTPQYRETTGIGRRQLLTMDEVLRLSVNRALVIIRGCKVLQVDKLDYSKHPDAKKLTPAKASAYIPSHEYDTNAEEPDVEMIGTKSRKRGGGRKNGRTDKENGDYEQMSLTPTDRDSIMT